MIADGAGERARESGKLVLALPDDAPPVGTMLAAFVQPAAGTRERSGGRLRVDGMLGVTLVYLPIDSQVPVSTRQDAPMSVQFACGLSADAAIALECVEAVASAITSDRVEVRFILSLEGVDCGAQPLQVVTDVTRTPAQAEPGAIVVYYPAQDETAWDVAKRYRVDARIPACAQSAAGGGACRRTGHCAQARHVRGMSRRKSAAIFLAQTHKTRYNKRKTARRARTCCAFRHARRSTGRWTSAPSGRTDTMSWIC